MFPVVNTSDSAAHLFIMAVYVCAIIVFVAFCIWGFIKTFNDRKRDKKKRAEEVAFLKEIFDGDWERRLVADLPNWKEIVVIQPLVDEILRKKAVDLNVACAGVNGAIKSTSKQDPKGRLSDLRRYEEKVAFAKKAYWQFSDTAKRLGFKTKGSHKDYLPEHATRFEEPSPEVVNA